ncbi:solute carrier organic anion transporter family member 4A1-like isoform X2 [Rhipicephalus microplus]|uniref:solute carrier organic anion transporter family member 4A1-like isoform X2 n=1 Tax=Rhipicephalus microplus TaxID=6941 RepID=UPI003F6B59D7
MATNKAGKSSDVKEGPPKAFTLPPRTGAQGPEVSTITAEAKRRYTGDSFLPTAGASLCAGARGPSASPVVIVPPPTKEDAPAGAAGTAAGGRSLEQPDPSAAQKKRCPPAIVAIPIAALSPLSPLDTEIIATPLTKREPLAFRTKKEREKGEAFRPSIDAGHRRGPNEVVEPLLPVVKQSVQMGAPDDLRARRQHLPSRSSPICLRPMAIGPAGTPELVAFPSRWHRRQVRLALEPEFAGDTDDRLGVSSPKEVYPVMDTAEDETPGCWATTPQVPQPEKEDQQCGWLWFRPAFFRRFRTPGWVLISLCSIEFTQSFVNSGVFSVVLPTIERRFNLSSFETGMLLSAFSVANCLFIVPVAFLGSTRKKPLIIASGMAIMSAGSFLFFLTYVIEPSYAYGSELPDLCYATPPPLNHTVEACGKERIRDARYLLLLGSMLQGAGVTPLHTLGMSFLDENLPARLTSLFVGTYSAMAVLGPAFGFLIAGYFLSVFVDFKDVSHLGLTTQSSVWVGAWWVGFLVAAVMGGIVSIPMAAFPKHLPSMICTAVGAFSVKFFEAEFAMTPSRTAATLGSILIPAGVGGTVIGGGLVSKLDLTVRAMLKMCCATSIIPWLCMWIFILHCPNPQYFHGEIWSNNRSVDFTSECNENCHCETTLLDPVCSVENVVYASPCYAGCVAKEIMPHPYDPSGDLQVYKNCSCVPTPLGAPMNETVYDFDAKREKCSTNCNLLVTYMVAIFICVFFSFFSAAPIITMMMRCVEEKERAVGLAVKWVSVRLFGNIPAPLLLGSVIDRSCLLWQEACQKRGACLLYNNEHLALSMLEFLVPVKTLSIMLFCAALITVPDDE